MSRVRESGFILIATSLMLVAILGMAGLAVDLGRMYIVKSELQAYCDAATVAGALQLDGTVAGIARANAAAAGIGSGTNAMKWDMDTKQISGVTTSFAMGLASTPNQPDNNTWSASPANPVDYRFMQVVASSAVPVPFMQAFRLTQSGATQAAQTVAASAIAGQVLITSFPSGLLPFSPIGPTATPPNFGLTPGVQYTLRYPAPTGQKIAVCAGDVNQPYVNNLPSQDRGYWGSTSAAALRGEILDTQQSQTLVIGQAVPMVGGNKTTEGSALDIRVQEDSDPTSATYRDYMNLGQGNGRRIVGVPINNGPPNFVAIGIGAFFLLPQGVYTTVTGSTPICAEYIGPWVQGSMNGGAGGSAQTGDTGGYFVRLVQ